MNEWGKNKEYPKRLKYFLMVILGEVSQFSSVQSLSCVQLFATPWTVALQASQPFTNLEFTQTQVQWVGDAIQPSHPLLSPSLSAFSFSQHQGEVSQRKRNITWYPLYAESKNKWYTWTYLQNKNWLADLESRLMVKGLRLGEGTVREFGIDMYVLLYLKCIINKIVL